MTDFRARTAPALTKEALDFAIHAAEKSLLADAPIEAGDIPQVQVVRSELKLNGLPAITYGNGEDAIKIIPASNNRSGLLIVAGSNNNGNIWICSKKANFGIPLRRGASWTLDTKYPVETFGDDSGDILYLVSQDKE